MKNYHITICLLIGLFFTTSKAQNKKNILFICIDDLRPELKSFGADYIISPNIDALAKKGRPFYNHYVNAPSCGPSRYTMLMGTYGPAQNDAIFKRAKDIKQNKAVNLSMPEWFKNNGYTTVSLGKVSHHPGGLGGVDWNDPNTIEMPNAWDKSLIPVKEWQHPRGVMHGLSNGEVRGKVAKSMDVFQSTVGEDTIYPDGHITNKAIEQLENFSKTKKPFFFAVGLIKPHLPFGAPKKYYDRYKNINIPDAAFSQKPNWPSTWHGSGEFMKYNRWGKDPRADKGFANEVKKHYAACVTYADAQVGRILAKLKETGLDKNTVIVLWGDHGWSLGEHAIWGKHSLFEEALHSPLIIVDHCVKDKGKGTNAVVETVDIFPTLCDLTNLSIPDFTIGVSLKPLLKNVKTKGHNAYAYKRGKKTIRTDRYRLVVSNKGSAELFDHQEDPYETKNIASKHPDVVKELKELLKQKDLQRN
ncbi:sulfatase [Wenyingzhuangia sp. 2_MG-2023]|uniref:sulfatase n=1 Tax=Wenyingzhuangia sp. 2_MG-2023 TaxID=3062639 RepID=UPI0026E1D4A6|nr:sulfatase [Wenyingzhuangia sp. 2_MG-2023]MDO6737987.1 sulfatase [Wenyingzhuangia sp. 2_MG-2023]